MHPSGKNCLHQCFVVQLILMLVLEVSFTLVKKKNPWLKNSFVYSVSGFNLEITKCLEDLLTTCLNKSNEVANAEPPQYCGLKKYNFDRFPTSSAVSENSAWVSIYFR